MTRFQRRILGAVLAAWALAALGADCCAGLTGQQRSLAGVKLLTVRVNCSELAKEVGLDEQTLQRDISRRLESAGIGVARAQIWATLPGRCRFIATVNVSRPRHLDTLMYNLTGEFVQTVSLARLPDARIDAATWRQSWFAHGSKKRLVEVVPHNLSVMAAAFIRDHRLANPAGGKVPDSSVSGGNSDTTSKQPPGAIVPVSAFIASKSSSVFHKSDCRWAQTISADNLISYHNREQAVKAGKRPCKRCNP